MKKQKLKDKFHERPKPDKRFWDEFCVCEKCGKILRKDKAIKKVIKTTVEKVERDSFSLIITGKKYFAYYCPECVPKKSLFRKLLDIFV